MSYSGSITLWITPNAPSSPVILRSLLDSGWRPGNGYGNIVVFDKERDFVKFETADEALAAIAGMEARDEKWWFPIFWAGVASVEVVIDRRAAMANFLLSPSPKRLDSVPWCSDHNWYLSRLVPPLQKVGCGVNDLKYVDR